MKSSEKNKIVRKSVGKCAARDGKGGCKQDGKGGDSYWPLWASEKTTGYRPSLFALKTGLKYSQDRFEKDIKDYSKKNFVRPLSSYFKKGVTKDK